MTAWAWLLAGGLASGLVLVATSLPILRRPSLADRVDPYLGLVARPSTLLRDSEGELAWPIFERLVRPILKDGVRTVDRVFGGAVSAQTRLDRLGPDHTLEQFRFEQLLAGCAGFALGVGLLALRGLGSSLSTLAPSLFLLALAFAAGVLARDRLLSIAVAKRTARMRTEFPTVVELIALGVGAGQGLVSAMERVSRLGSGAFVGELNRSLDDMRGGTSTIDALQNLAGRVDLVEVRRFVDALVVAVERGTPLVDVLQAQAVDARESSRRALIEAGGRKEISMMVPVVFLVLPLSVIFALFPGFYGLSLGST
jgi:tight adherence protein C